MKVSLATLVPPEKYHEWRLSDWLADYFPPFAMRLAAQQYELMGGLDHIRFEILIRPPYTRYIWIFGELVWRQDYPELGFGRPK